ncbi:MAG: DUF2203 domain-containing protein [Ignavibacteria bacterium]|nr:DUF2203 domain-containing protein [Ignavibacteria bacterium]
MFHNKHFELSEARMLLKDIKHKLSRIVELKNKLDEAGFDINKHQFFGGFGPNGTGKFPGDLEDLVTLVREITSEGILIKDLNSGLIDFPHIRSNHEEVYLCYLNGEDDINYWHRIQDGFAGRRTMDEL